MSKITNSSVGVFNKRLAAYTAGAGAAMIAAPGMASADIIWSGHLTIDFGVGNVHLLTMEGNDPEMYFVGGDDTGSIGIGVIALGIVGEIDVISALQNTQEVNAGLSFLNVGFFFNSTTSLSKGAWNENGFVGYFGFRFTLDDASPNAAVGTTVYGWAQVERVSPSSGRLLQWAYEDSGAPIQVGAVPEPGTLSLLALGAAGIAALRKRRNGVA